MSVRRTSGWGWALLLVSGCSSGPAFKAVEVQPEPERRAVAVQTPSVSPEQQTQGSEAAPVPAATAIRWPLLRGLDVRTGKADARLEAMNGTEVKLAGYMVPFSDDLESVTEFLLVPSAGMCVHKPAPPPNQIVLVQMAAGTVRVDWSTAVEVTGALHIDEGDSPFGKASFRMAATAVGKW